MPLELIFKLDNGQQFLLDVDSSIPVSIVKEELSQRIAGEVAPTQIKVRSRASERSRSAPFFSN